MQCPGQDTRYWKPEDVHEVACQKCGTAVEFFKTDAARRCPGCGERVQNPKVSLGCARWCAYAKECLGFDPSQVHVEDNTEGSLADRLVAAARNALGGGPEALQVLARALQVVDRARQILLEEEGDPRVVLSAALLLDVGAPRAAAVHASTAAKFHEAEGRVIARRLLAELKVDGPTTDHVCQIVGSHHSADEVDTPEYRVVCDADLLVRAVEARPGVGHAPPVGATYRTDTGRRLAAEPATSSTAQA
ncbi:MAG: HD domain-containing protein [Gemmatimonadota bacterium]